MKKKKKTKLIFYLFRNIRVDLSFTKSNGTYNDSYTFFSFADATLTGEKKQTNMNRKNKHE